MIASHPELVRLNHERSGSLFVAIPLRPEIASVGPTDVQANSLMPAGAEIYRQEVWCAAKEPLVIRSWPERTVPAQ
jgi:hypothetical protein